VAYITPRTYLYLDKNQLNLNSWRIRGMPSAFMPSPDTALKEESDHHDSGGRSQRYLHHTDKTDVVRSKIKCLNEGSMEMMKQLAFRSLAAASLVIGGSIVFGPARTSAQWTASPDAPPISCSSWQTQFGGGMCRVEHFNGNTSAPAGPPGNAAVSPGTGLTGISPGSATNGPIINSGSSTGGGSSTSDSGSGAAASSSGAAGASDSGAGAGGAGASGAGGAGAGGAGGAGASGSGGAGGSGGSGGSGGGGGSQ
jgi:hypothetical protein